LTAIDLAYQTLLQARLERAVMWDGIPGKNFGLSQIAKRRFLRIAPAFLLLATLPSVAGIPWIGKKKDGPDYGTGLIINVPFPVDEVEQVVQEVAQNTIIRGTKEYNKDQYVEKAVEVESTPVFPAWKERGKVYYKVRTQALDPMNFKDSADVGTLGVRYVVQPQGENHTILRIDAVFVEDFRKVSHASDGSVESAEYKDIQDKIAVIEQMKRETAEALRQKQEHLTKKNFGLSINSSPSASANGGESSSKQNIGNATEELSTPAASSLAQAIPDAVATTAIRSSYAYAPGETLEQHITKLRQLVERVVKKPGAPLKSAPFHSANTLKSLDPGTEVLIQIETAYWYGVETRDGEHGWLRRDELEPAQ
jgi:hypothetical protein